MKYFALLISLFCVFSLSIAQQCNIQYESYAAPPECTWVIDDNGEETEQCTSIGTAAYAGQLTPDDPSFTETFPVSTFSWDGTCDCTVTYWRDDNGKGCHVRRDFGQGKETTLTTDSVLKVQPGSITISCQFEV